MSLLESFFSLAFKDRIIILILLSVFMMICLIDFRKIEFDTVKIVEAVLFGIVLILLFLMLERDVFKTVIILLPLFSIFMFLKYIDYDRYSLYDRIKLLKIYIICIICFSLFSFLLLKIYDFAHHIQGSV